MRQTQANGQQAMKTGRGTRCRNFSKEQELSFLAVPSVRFWPPSKQLPILYGMTSTLQDYVPSKLELQFALANSKVSRQSLIDLAFCLGDQ